jgi:O-antigen/teichoic acid export membrane protein
LATPASTISLNRSLPALESSALGATVWTIAAYGAGQVLRIANSLVLTRLIAPEAFGLMALLTTLIVGLTLLSDVGLEEGVIQNARGTATELINTAYCIQAMRGAGIWVVSMLVAWPASRFYHEPKILFLLPVVGLGSAISGLNSINVLTLIRDLNAKRLYTVNLVIQLIQLIVTVGWALIYPSVWALAGGTLVSYGIRLAVSHDSRIIPGIRNRFVWDALAAKGLMEFGRWIVFGTAAFFFASQADRLFLGKVATFAVLGVYGVAFSLADIPRQVVLMFCSRVGHPFLIALVDKPRSEFRRVFLRYRGFVLLAGATLLSIFVNVGGPMVMKVYDSRYRDAGWMVPILALGLWHTLLYSTLKPALYAVGKTAYNALGSSLYLAATVVVVPVGFHFWGLRGAVVAVAAADLPFYFVNAYGASREGLRCWGQDAKITAVFLVLLLLGFGLSRYFAG